MLKTKKLLTTLVFALVLVFGTGMTAFACDTWHMQGQPSYPGYALTTKLAGKYDNNVVKLQSMLNDMSKYHNTYAWDPWDDAGGRYVLLNNQSGPYYTQYTLVADGSFGPATKAAVMNFQANNGLTVDGSCGPATWAKLNEHYCGKVTVPEWASKNWTRYINGPLHNYY